MRIVYNDKFIYIETNNDSYDDSYVQYEPNMNIEHLLVYRTDRVEFRRQASPADYVVLLQQLQHMSDDEDLLEPSIQCEITNKIHNCTIPANVLSSLSTRYVQQLMHQGNSFVNADAYDTSEHRFDLDSLNPKTTPLNIVNVLCNRSTEKLSHFPDVRMITFVERIPRAFTLFAQITHLTVKECDSDTLSEFTCLTYLELKSQSPKTSLMLHDANHPLYTSLQELHVTERESSITDACLRRMKSLRVVTGMCDETRFQFLAKDENHPLCHTLTDVECIMTPAAIQNAKSLKSCKYHIKEIVEFGDPSLYRVFDTINFQSDEPAVAEMINVSFLRFDASRVSLKYLTVDNPMCENVNQLVIDRTNDCDDCGYVLDEAKLALFRNVKKLFLQKCVFVVG